MAEWNQARVEWSMKLFVYSSVLGVVCTGRCAHKRTMEDMLVTRCGQWVQLPSKILLLDSDEALDCMVEVQ